MPVHVIFKNMSKFIYPANIYLFKVNNRSTRKRREICSKLLKTPEWRQWCRSGVFIVDFQQMNVSWVLHNKSSYFQLWELLQKTGKYWKNIAEVWSEPCYSSKMELLVETENGFKLLTIFGKCSVLDAQHDSEYTYAFIVFLQL